MSVSIKQSRIALSGRMRWEDEQCVIDSQTNTSTVALSGVLKPFLQHGNTDLSSAHSDNSCFLSSPQVSPEPDTVCQHLVACFSLSSVYQSVCLCLHLLTHMSINVDVSFCFMHLSLLSYFLIFMEDIRIKQKRENIDRPERKVLWDVQFSSLWFSTTFHCHGQKSWIR